MNVNCDGPTGPGFISAIIDSDSNLIIYRSDYSTFNAGHIGCYNTVDHVVVDTVGNLIVFYTNGTCKNLGPVVGPTGPCCTGPDGLYIINAFEDECGYLS